MLATSLLCARGQRGCPTHVRTSKASFPGDDNREDSWEWTKGRTVKKKKGRYCTTADACPQHAGRNGIFQTVTTLQVFCLLSYYRKTEDEKNKLWHRPARRGGMQPEARCVTAVHSRSGFFFLDSWVASIVGPFPEGKPCIRSAVRAA